MSTTKVNIPFRRTSSRQSSMDGRVSLSWNRRSEVFKASESGSVPLGPDELEIDRIYGQIHTLMETLNEKFGLTVKKKEDNCMVAFKQVMKSIEKDLRDIKQQVDESQKVTKDDEDSQAINNLQKQLAFFRDESVTLAKKLKLSENNVKELKRKNKQLEADLDQEHRMLLKSEKEKKALKIAVSSLGNTYFTDVEPDSFEPNSALTGRRSTNLGSDWNENRDDSPIESKGGSATDRTGTRSSSTKNIESKYKKDNLQLNSLKEQLDQVLKKKIGFLNTDKLNEVVSIVMGVVSKKVQIQEQQISLLNMKITKLRQYYQFLLRSQSGTDLPFGLDELLFIFWDMLHLYKIKDRGESAGGKLSSRAIPKDTSKNSPMSYRHLLEPNKPDRNVVLDSIRNGNKKYAQLTKDDKLKIMQTLMDDPIVDGLLDHYAQAMQFQRKLNVSPVQQLAKIRATGSYPQTPVGNDLMSSDDEQQKVAQEPVFKDGFFFARARKQHLSSLNNSNLEKEKSWSMMSKYQSPDFGGEISMPLHSFGDSDSPNYKASLPVSLPSQGIDTAKKASRDNNPFDKGDSVSGAELSFSTPKGFVEKAAEELREIQMPLGEEKVGGKDFRRRFLVKNGKLPYNEDI